LAASAAQVRFWGVADIRASVDGSAPAASDRSGHWARMPGSAKSSDRIETIGNSGPKRYGGAYAGDDVA